jgi:hypothetical protein
MVASRRRAAAAISAALCASQSAAFTARNIGLTLPGFIAPRNIRPGLITCSTALPSTPEANAAADDGNDQGHAMQPFFEETALEGADAVKAMSIEERTRRAMLAEQVEDRVCTLYDDLEDILGQDGTLPESEEEREEITNIAKQIKVLQNDYKQLVSGEKSPLLDGFGFGENE